MKSARPTAAGIAALRPRHMTPEQIADLVARARGKDERGRAEGIAKQVAACRATLEARRYKAERAAAELEARKRYESFMRRADDDPHHHRVGRAG